MTPRKVIQQYLNAGLLDEIRVDLVPVLLEMHLLDNRDSTPVRLAGPRVIQGTGVTPPVLRRHVTRG